MTSHSAQDLIRRFDDLQKEQFSLKYALGIINFDHETIAPPAGGAACAEASALLAQRLHEISYGPEVAELLDALEACSADLDESHAAQVHEAGRQYRLYSSVPASFSAEFSRLTTLAGMEWKRAKQTEDFDAFAPYIERIVEGLKEQACYIDATKDSYDVLLDTFEPGLSCKDLDEFFQTVQDGIVPLLTKITAAQTDEIPSFVHTVIPPETQRRICMDLACLMGLNMDALYMSETEHPFCSGFCHADVRIANHFYPDNPLSAVYSLMHEGGHALYEQGIDPQYDYTCLSGGVSMGIHESQSRFMENIIGRSEPFSRHLLALIRRHTTGQFDEVGEDEFFRAICRVQPDFIRTEADELTYPLHILVRYRVESALFKGEIRVQELPDVWHDLMQEVLGLDVRTHSQGVLQDGHWSMGAFGYFPSYAIGNAYASQFLKAMSKTIDVYECVQRADLGPIRAWLQEHVWRFGCSRQPARIIEEACGSTLDAHCYVDYLCDKYGKVYAGRI